MFCDKYFDSDMARAFQLKMVQLCWGFFFSLVIVLYIENKNA